MKENTKRNLKLSCIWSFVFCVGVLLFSLYCALSMDISFNIGYFIPYFVVNLALYLGILFYLIRDILIAVLILYFLFKKFTSTNARIIITAFFLPFMIYVQCFLGRYIFSSFLADSSDYLILIIILFITLISSLIASKKLLPIKKEVCITCTLMIVFSAMFMWFNGLFLERIYNKTTLSKLNQYETVIMTIEDYKKQNGIYPNKIKDNVKIFKKFAYKVYDDKKGYVLMIQDEDGTLYMYDYLSKSWEHKGKVPKEIKQRDKKGKINVLQEMWK